MDIVERLRRTVMFSPIYNDRADLEQAADEIERLRLEVAAREHAYTIACAAGEAGPHARWVCQLCHARRPQLDHGRTMVSAELLHESGERETVQRLCPRCGGTGIDPCEELPELPALGAGDQVEEVEAYPDGSGATVSVRRSDGRLTRHQVTLEQGRELGKRMYQVEGAVGDINKSVMYQENPIRVIREIMNEK